MPFLSLAQPAAPTTNGHSNGRANGQTNGQVAEEETRRRKDSDSDTDSDDSDDEDPWEKTSPQKYKPWGELTPKEKVVRVASYTVRIILVLGFLYLFICSLDFLSSAFKLLGGKKAGEVFQQSDILTNPVAGLMMGVLVTVLVQSSSTSTSIVISMVGAKILTVKTAVPIVMGANIGTSVTNTIVALGQINNSKSFRRAFSGATIHDMFNWLTVIILLPLEVATGYLFKLSDVLVNSMNLKTLDTKQDLLKTITKPFTKLVIEVSSSGIKDIAHGKKSASEVTMLKLCCDETKPASCCSDRLDKLSFYGGPRPYSYDQRTDVCLAVDQCVMKNYSALPEQLDQCTSVPWKREDVTVHLNDLHCQTLPGNSSQQDCCLNLLNSSSFVTSGLNATTAQQTALCTSVNSTCYTGTDVYDACASAWGMGREMQGVVFDCGNWTKTLETTCNKPCDFLFHDTHEKAGGSLSDEATGGILLVLSLVVLCVCLVFIVKLLQSLLEGPMSKVIKKFVNANFPGYCAYFTGYLAILIGAGMTILVQSSSIFTSTLTPLVGMGVIELDRMYPLTLGSNIGTTATGILAALAQDVEDMPPSLQVALCHLFFNISGILILYPFPFFRPPIPAANFLGKVTSKHRWFALAYLFFIFFLAPLAVFALSIPGWYVLAAVLIPIALVVIFVSVVKCFQAKRPGALPAKLRTWEWLPLPLRSLVPYDSCMRKVLFCKRFQQKKRVPKNATMTAQQQPQQPQQQQTGEKKGITNEGFDGVIITKL